MKKTSLKLKNYANNVNIIDNNNLRRRILNIMFLILGVLVFFYLYFLGSMIFNIVERKTLSVYAYTLSNDVGNLELKYLAMSQKVDLNLAYSLGFKETKTEFAIRKTLGSIRISKNEI